MKRHGSPITLFSFQDIITGLCGLMILLVLVMLIDVIRSRGEPEASPIELTGSFSELESEIADLKSKFSRNEEKLSASVLTNATTAIESIQTTRSVLADKTQVIQGLQARVAEQEQANEERQAKKRETDEMKREQEKIRASLETAITRYGKNMLTIIPERGIAKMPVYVECSGSEVKIHRPLHGLPSSTLPYTRSLDGVFEVADATNPATSYFLLLVKPSALGYAFDLKYKLSQKGFNIGIDPILEDVVLNFENLSEGGA